MHLLTGQDGIENLDKVYYSVTVNQNFLLTFPLEFPV